MSNTSQDETRTETLEIVDQDTLNQALSQDELTTAEEVVVEDTDTEESKEPKEPEKKEKILGKYGNTDDLVNAYTSLQTEFNKRNEELKKLKTSLKEKERESIQSLGYDEQVKYLVDRITELEAQQEEKQNEAMQYSMEALHQQDMQNLNSFISKTPELVETGFDDLFKEIALRPEYREYSFESIYNTLLKPKIEKLMGTKVKTKERLIKGQAKQERTGDLSDVSKSEYEKNRLDYLREAGINI